MEILKGLRRWRAMDTGFGDSSETPPPVYLIPSPPHCLCVEGRM